MHGALLSASHSGYRYSAIELLNEPTLPPKELLDYYRRAYAAVRDGGMDASRVAVVVNLFMTGDVLTEVHSALHGAFHSALHGALHGAL